jgi:LAGLIDADG DNA endonuclease family protein
VDGRVVTIRQVGDSLITPDNQQERLGDYLSGYIDGEGSFHVAIQRNPTTRLKWQLVPEFHVSQNPERASVLRLLKQQLGCGRLQRNAKLGSRDKSLVFVVRCRKDLIERVIPFLESHPLLSEKKFEFEAFAGIVRAMDEGEHLTDSGFHRLVAVAESMNGNGRYRREKWSNRILRGHMPDMDQESMKIWSDPHGDVGSQAETETTWPPH